MAVTETSQEHSRTARRRPFTTWVKKLAHFKGGASSSSSASGAARHLGKSSAATKKRPSKNNNPYPLSGRLGVIDNPNRFASDGEDENDESSEHYYSGPHRSQPSFAGHSGATPSSMSIGRSRRSSLIESASDDGRAPPTAGALSVAPTVSTDHGTPRSVLAPSAGAASSITGTSRTINGPGSRRGGDSTFSSPAPSVRSLTTTLTTIQSLAPAAAMGQANGVGGGGGGGAASNGTASVGMTFSNHLGPPSGHGHSHHHHTASQQSNGTQTIQFHQPFPSTPASAIPSHLTPLPHNAGPGHPATYSTATANNLLTDNASILTLASSSKRRRRRSIDTDASVRALAPSSLFGGSRESLPLSVLSANMEGPSSTSALMPSTSASSNANAQGPAPGGPVALHATNSRMSVASAGLASPAAVAAAAERTSIYSATGTGMLGGGDRNSFYARQSLGGGGGGGVAGDGASIRSGRSGRSGFLGHGRSESITGSIGGSLTSPLASPLASPRETEAEEASTDLITSVATVKTAVTDDAVNGEAAAKADEEK
ncbi:uncharacterized protein SPSK_00258 [Sporothrix schenckii 1099-18]|uniref:Ca2+-modulated nonselective cation channel polycystin n=1 Tax=Sporothrix schenckii 1099-18 TaxID=1397361 RepID=A0A0F2M2V7_SPOSC|nr:uncharacterized protein SPSK_00258 [Sporothrix schenckii 1099-18]KJR84032.1 hypothetical protein SPSK_00258 [Sporothrix schenckii 1099-18]